MTFGHLAEAAHTILVALGGTSRVWRTDRMATIVVPGTDRLTVDAANIAKHYGVEIAVCPPRRAQRKGVVEAAVKYTTKSWWRTAQIASMSDAQRSLDHWSVDVADQRPRGGQTVGELGACEPLSTLPPLAYPAVISVTRTVSRSALVAFEANHYSVTPAMVGRTVTVQTRVGASTLQIVSGAGVLVGEHRRASVGAGQRVRTPEHARLLEHAVLAAFTTSGRPCASKVNRPPGPDALAALARLKGVDEQPGNVRTFADYQRHAEAATALAGGVR
jgi:hypothetical protein